MACPGAAAAQASSAARSSGRGQCSARPRSNGLEHRAVASGSGRCGSWRRGGRRSPRRPARSPSTRTSAGRTPVERVARERARPSWLATWPRACTPASVRPATVSDDLAPAGRVASAVSSSPCTVRSPGWRAQPAKPAAVVGDIEPGGQGLPALARDDQQVVESNTTPPLAAEPAPEHLEHVLAHLRRTSSRIERLAGGLLRRGRCPSRSPSASSGEAQPERAASRRSELDRARPGPRSARGRCPPRPSRRGSGTSSGPAARTCARPRSSSARTAVRAASSPSRRFRPGRTTRNSSAADPLGPRREHRAEDGAAQSKRPSSNGQLLGVRLHPLDRRSPRPPCARVPSSTMRAEVGGHHARALARGRRAARLPLPAATSSTSWPAETAQASARARARRLELLRERRVVAARPLCLGALLQLLDVHAGQRIG